MEPLRYISSPGGCFHTHLAYKEMEFTWSKQIFLQPCSSRGKRNCGLKLAELMDSWTHLRTVKSIIFRKSLSLLKLLQHINGITLAVWFKFSGLLLALSQSKILNHWQRKSQINKNILAYNKMSHANRKFLSSLFWQLSVAKYARLTFTSPFPVPSYLHLLSSAWKTCNHESLTICPPPAIC